MAKPNIALGLFSAVAVIFLWSGFMVFSRAGVSTSLTAYDLAALRFLVAGTLVLPFVRAWWPRNLSIKAMLVIMLSGPGALNTVFMYLGLSEAPAAYGAVFANGSMPIFTIFIVFMVTRGRPGKTQLAATAIIILGAILLGFRAMSMGGGGDVAKGITLFLAASALISVYIFAVQYWQVSPRQALVLVNLPSALIYLPIWFFFLPSGLAEAEISVVVFQALFQGLGPGFLALIFFTLAAMHLGPTTTAGFSAAVPATAALLAIPVLNEVPTTLEWTGIATVSLGLAILFMRR